MAKRAVKTDYEIVYTFRLLHDGWEMDNEAHIARDKKGKLVWLGSSHGGLYDYGQDVAELLEKREETQRSLDGINKALEMLKADK